MIIKSLRGKSCLDRTDVLRGNKKIIEIACKKIVKFPFKGNIFAPTFY